MCRLSGFADSDSYYTVELVSTTSLQAHPPTPKLIVDDTYDMVSV